MPQIPPRPTRTRDQALPKSAATALRGDIPKIPPRPANRRLDRSQSPSRDSFAQSPLNEPSFVASLGKSPPSGNGNAYISTADLPRRPPSVSLPSLGQEGNEYAEVFSVVVEPDPSPTQTRSVANDLHLHAPRPSLPVSSAKQRVSLVTRTDSSQAAALGIGKANSDDKEPHARSLKAKASNLSQNSNSTERPPSSCDNEHGIPEIGQRVPMYPNAGDVQAPSPSPFVAQHNSGAGLHIDGSKPRHHGRKTSARGFEGPPGSYGLHGHGIIPKDRFEQAYYEKHPDLLQKEIGQYGGAIGDGRGQWALSSEDLNKIVRETASRGTGLGEYLRRNSTIAD
jgi:Altered inheritance of mitochondria protein 21